jgi:hypothetical protein
MSKIFAIAASAWKDVVVVATSALARGDALPVVLIALIFDLAVQIGRTPVPIHTNPGE